MADWQDLDQEIALWRKAGRDATFWWRDDDATEPTAALDRLIEISARHRVPCALAVVPRPATEDLFEQLNGSPGIFPVQHGYQHHNHEPKGEKASEFGAHRDRASAEQEFAVGWRRLQPLRQLAPVFVPPWNKMNDAFNACLAGLGLKGVSQHNPRQTMLVKGGLHQVNTHVDIINWRGSGQFVGEAKALGFVLSHLQGRRTGAVDASEPTGLLTHHLDHDAECWRFMDELMDWTHGQSGVRWLTPFEAFDINRDDDPVDR